jgi:hypothetical protein
MPNFAVEIVCLTLIPGTTSGTPNMVPVNDTPPRSRPPAPTSVLGNEHDVRGALGGS